MPVIPITAIAPGWHQATIEGFSFRPSTRDNPMVEVDLILDTGELTSLYLLVTYDGKGYRDLFHSVGEHTVAEEITGRHIPSFELDQLIGASLKVYVPHSGPIRLHAYEYRHFK